MTVNLNHVANQVTTTGSASDLDLNVTTKGNGNLVFQTANTTQFRVTPQSAAVNYFQVKGSASTERPILSVTGSDTNIGLVLQTKNTGSVTAQNDGGYPAVVLNTSTSGQTVTMSAYGIVVSGFNTDIPYDISSKGKSEVSLSTQYGAHLKVGRTDSATNSIINYVQISGSFSGNPVSINALGSDTNIPVYYYSKGTGKHSFYSSTTTANPQFSISPTASPVNYLQVAAGTGFNEPTLSVISGSWADVDLGLVPLGTGMVKTSGTGIKLSGSSSGYVGLKGAAAAGSTTYTLPAADGTSGQVLSTNGSGVMSWATAGGGGGGGLGGQAFTSSGTFTIPSGVTALKITVIGAQGGGGGGSYPTGQYGGAGGAGGTAVQWYTGLTPSGTLTVTVGTGALGGLATTSYPGTGATGSTGGTSSVASGTQSITTISATGGSGGTGGVGACCSYAGSPGSGGSGSNSAIPFSSIRGSGTVGGANPIIGACTGGTGGPPTSGARGGTGQNGFVFIEW